MDLKTKIFINVFRGVFGVITNIGFLKSLLEM